MTSGGNACSHCFLKRRVDLAARRLDACHEVLVDLHPACALLAGRLQLLSRFLQFKPSLGTGSHDPENSTKQRLEVRFHTLNVRLCNCVTMLPLSCAYQGKGFKPDRQRLAARSSEQVGAAC